MCVRVRLHVCVRARVRAFCVDAFASVYVCMRAGLRAIACGRGYVGGLSVCAFVCVRVAVLLMGALGLLSWYLRDS